MPEPPGPQGHRAPMSSAWGLLGKGQCETGPLARPAKRSPGGSLASGWKLWVGCVRWRPWPYAWASAALMTARSRLVLVERRRGLWACPDPNPFPDWLNSSEAKHDGCCNLKQEPLPFEKQASLSSPHCLELVKNPGWPASSLQVVAKSARRWIS